MLNRIFSVGAEVISADALQVYKSLNIGTAKPNPGVLSRIPYHLIDIINYKDQYSVGDFCRQADECVRHILAANRLPVISGGTAYYLKAWLMGLPVTPSSDSLIRTRLEEKWTGISDEILGEEVHRFDPVSASRIGKHDRYRMLRVLEVHAQSGRPLSSFPVPDTPREDYQTLLIGLKRERAELYRRINERVALMFKDGLPREVAALRRDGAGREHPGMKAIGYREWFALPGEPEPDDEAVQKLIARNTRRYAKRQITFFSSLPDVHWFDAGEDPEAPGGIIQLVSDFLKDRSVFNLS